MYPFQTKRYEHVFVLVFLSISITAILTRCHEIAASFVEFHHTKDKSHHCKVSSNFITNVLRQGFVKRVYVPLPNKEV